MKKLLMVILLILIPLFTFATYVSVDWRTLTTDAAFGPRDKMGLVSYHPPTAPPGFNLLTLCFGDHQDLNYYSDVWNTGNGVNWTLVSNNNQMNNTGLGIIPYNTLVNMNGILYSLAQSDGSIWSSSNGGATWQEISTTSPFGTYQNFTSVVFNSRIFVIGGYTAGDLQNHTSVYSSSDGITWMLNTASAPWMGRTAGAACAFNGKLYFGFGTQWHSSLYFSDVWTTTDGTNWTQIDNCYNSAGELSYCSSANGTDNAFMFTNNSYLWIYTPIRGFYDPIVSSYEYTSDGVNWFRPDEVSGDSSLITFREQAIAIMGNNIVSVGGYNSATELDTNLVMMGEISYVSTPPTSTPIVLTGSPTNTPTFLIPTRTVTPTFTNSPTSTITLINTATVTPTNTEMGTFTNSPTNTPYATFTNTPMNTATSTFTNTISPTFTPMNTYIGTSTSTPTFTVTTTPTAFPTPWLQYSFTKDNRVQFVWTAFPDLNETILFQYGYSLEQSSYIDDNYSTSQSPTQFCYTICCLPYTSTYMVRVTVYVAGQVLISNTVDVSPQASPTPRG